MKDILSAFNTDVFRPIITLFVPGAIAISSWFIALLQREPKVAALAGGNHSETALLLVVASLFAGMLVENWGSWLESTFLDNLRNRRPKGEFLQDWDAYLLIAYKTDPVARRYLRTLLQRLKFELDSAVALLIGAVGLWWIEMPHAWSHGLRVGTVVVALYLIVFEARATHKLMGEVRHNLLHGTIRLIGDDTTATSAAAGK